LRLVAEALGHALASAASESVSAPFPRRRFQVLKARSPARNWRRISDARVGVSIASPYSCA